VISVDTSGGTVGLVTLNSEGAGSYHPNGQFDFLKSTDDDTDSFDYTISDGRGGTHTATVTVTINGVDDNPSKDKVLVCHDDNILEIGKSSLAAHLAHGDTEGVCEEETEEEPENTVLVCHDENILEIGESDMATHLAHGDTEDACSESLTVSITSPSDGDSFEKGASITFSGTVSDSKDNELSNDISWSSNIDGHLGVNLFSDAAFSDGK